MRAETRASTILRVALAFGFGLFAARAPASRSFDTSAPAGVTPSGLLWRFASGEVALFSVDGDERDRRRVGPDEKFVLSVSDDGSRISSPWPGGVKAGGHMEQTRRARLVFRDAAGNVLRTVQLEDLDSEPAFRGNEAFAVSRDRGDFVLHRTSSSEERTELLRVGRKKVLGVVGKISELQVHVTSAGIVLEVRGPYRSAFLGLDGAMLLPDPAADCGAWDAARIAFPGPQGSLYRVRSSSRYGPTRGSHRLEHVAKDGRLLSSARFPAPGTSLPLPGGDFVVLSSDEAVFYDSRGTEIRRTLLPPPGGVSKESAARVAAARSRFRSPNPTGADWVELALASPDPPWLELDAVGKDLRGALERVSVVPDGSRDAGRAAEIAAVLLNQIPYAEASGKGTAAPWEGLRSRLKERTEALAAWVDERAPSSPVWFQEVAGPWILTARPKGAPSWAFEAIARKIAKGEVPSVPDHVLTAEMAERIALLDRDRLDEADRTPRAGTAAGEGSATRAMFHVPASRFPEQILACLPGAGPARFRAAVVRLAEPGFEMKAEARHGWSEDDETPDGEASPPGVPSPRSVEAAGRVAALLADASSSASKDVRAAVQLLSPWYGRPLDAAEFAREVLPRAEASELAVDALLTDRSLHAEAWKRLFSGLLRSARGRSRNPVRCVTALSSPFDESDEPEEPDPYCFLVQRVMAGAASAGALDFDGRPMTGRSAELIEVARASGAPPELRLFGALGRGYAGQASAREVLELWNDPELPGQLRISLLQSLTYDDERKPQALEALPELVRQLREGRLPASEEAAVLAVVSAVGPSEASRLVAERLLAGRLRPADADSAEAWLKPLETSAVASSPELRDALKLLLADENVGPHAAAVLAKAGEPEAIPQLLFGLKTGCFT